MELYQTSKYENIADRLKRLSNSNSSNIPEMTIQQAKEKRLPYQNRREYTQLPKRSNKYIQGTTYSKYSTIEGERAEEQSSYSRIQDLLSPRDIRPAQQIERKAANIKATQYKLEKDRQDEESYKYEHKEENSRAMAKVRSDGNIKIDEILESFNNYRQNKVKFLSTLGKQLPCVQTGQYPEVQSQEISEKKQLPQQRSRGRHFKQINNIWNEQQNDNVPKFQRSYNRTEPVELIADVFSPTIAQPTDRKSFSRSKLILRNISKPDQHQNVESNSLKTLISPRGPRMPGKICKNHDKTFTTSTRVAF